MKISVITAARNAAVTIQATLDSVSAQDHDPVEHIVVDGASTDGTLDLVKHHVSPIRLISEPDDGIYDAMNKGLRLATGEVVCFLNADDAFASARTLSLVAAAFAGSDSPDIVTGRVEFVDAERGRFAAACRFSHDLLARGRQPPHPSTFYRRTVFDRLGDYDLRYRIAADFELFCRMAEAGVRCRPIEEVLTTFACAGASAALSSHLESGRILRTYYGRWAAARYLAKNTALWLGGRLLRLGGLRRTFWHRFGRGDRP